ncbi:MAG: alpha/beta hydrolase [Sneathiellaceae bacterium]
MPMADSRGAQIHYEVFGEGMPVLFLHEFAGDHRSWIDQVRRFARGHRCICLSARGYPPSDAPADADSYSQALANADALAVLDALAIEQAHIVGLSMGAYTALQLAIYHPARVRAVVAASGGSGAYRPTRDAFIAQTLASADAIQAAGALPVEEMGIAATRIQLLRKDPLGWALFCANLSEHPAQAAAHTLRGIQAARPSLYDLETALSQVDAPVLLLVGDEDEPCLDVNLWLKRIMRTARLQVLPGTGHAVNLEEPAAFNAAVASFLDAVETGRWRPRDPLAAAGADIYRGR